MISHIFKDKIKNILAIVFTVLYIVISIGDMIYELRLWQTPRLMPYVLILVYLLTLKKEYKFKELLFPFAFIFQIVLSIYSVAISTIDYLKIMTDVDDVGLLLLTTVSNLITISAYILCLIGSISSFKKAEILKVGLFVLMMMTGINILLNLIYMGSLLWSDIERNYLMPVIKSYIRGILKLVFVLLFEFGIFNLTLNKDDKKTDKTRFYKKEQQYQEQFEIEIPDSTDRCECGYKK